MSITVGLDARQCRLWRINRSCSSKFPFLIQGHHRTIVFLLQGKKDGTMLLVFFHSKQKSLFYNPTRDSNNEKFVRKRKFQKYLHAYVWHLWNFSTKSTITLFLWQNLLKQNFIETYIFKPNKWMLELFSKQRICMSCKIIKLLVAGLINFLCNNCRW